MTTNQETYLRDLILRHPNFKQVYPYQKVFQEGVDGERMLRDEDGADIGKADEFCAAWVSEKYAQYLNSPIQKFQDLESEEASALIEHLKIGEQERYG